MKKLYRKGTVHPSPPVISDHLSFLPATILALTFALSPEDREVLAYLISCSNNISVNNLPGNVHPRKSKSPGAGGNNNNNNNSDHPPLFTCDCFRCYMTYWVRWDSSPNRQVIHEIIDAFEDELLQQKNEKMKNSKKEKKRRSGNRDDSSADLKRSNNSNHQLNSAKKSAESESIEEDSSINRTDDVEGDRHEGEEKSLVRSFVNFIGERIWGVWG